MSQGNRPGAQLYAVIVTPMTQQERRTTRSSRTLQNLEIKIFATESYNSAVRRMDQLPPDEDAYNPPFILSVFMPTHEDLACTFIPLSRRTMPNTLPIEAPNGISFDEEFEQQHFRGSQRAIKDFFETVRVLFQGSAYASFMWRDIIIPIVWRDGAWAHEGPC